MRTAYQLVLMILLLAGGAQAAPYVYEAHSCTPKAEAFTAETNYMSIPGKTAFDVYQRTGNWLDFRDCWMINFQGVPLGYIDADGFQEIVDVHELVPFSRQTKYLSVNGYLNWLALNSTPSVRSS